MLDKRPLQTRWAGARMSAQTLTAPWAGGLGRSYPWLAGWRGGVPAQARTRPAAGAAQHTQGGMRAPWRAGAPVWSLGGPWISPALVPEPLETCRVDDPSDDLQLLFQRASGNAPLNFLFSCWRPALVVVPVRKVYMVTNTLNLIRVSDGATIPCDGMTLDLDVDSWAWGFSASVPGDALSLVAPPGPGLPIELQASVNGLDVRVLVESIDSDRAFGRHTARISGRGKTALLDAPYASEQVFSSGSALTSQQLLDAALPFGWTVDWDMDPWLVPANVWSYQGTTLGAARTIAAAGGGFLLPDPVAQAMTVVSRYPTAPWDWASLTVDYSLPSAVTQREGISWVDFPSYNRVYVSGTTTGGVNGRITRDGSAGDILAPMVSDQLITHLDAATQRGRTILSKTGRIATVRLRLPVLPITGVIQPGKFVDYVDGPSTRRGLVRAVSVSAAMPEVWQTLTVETHE